MLVDEFCGGTKCTVLIEYEVRSMKCTVASVKCEVRSMKCTACGEMTSGPTSGFRV
jgi:hypothetical protein